MKIVIKLFFLFLFNSSSSLYNIIPQAQYSNIKKFSFNIIFRSSLYCRLLTDGEIYLSKGYAHYSFKELKTLFSEEQRYKYFQKLSERLKQSHNWLSNLVECYWKQYIIISLLNKNEQHILIAIRKFENSNDYRFRRIWQKQFIHDLSIGKVDFQMLNLNSSQGIPMIYLWKKGINFPRPERFNLLYRNLRTIDWPNNKHKLIMKNLNFSSILVPINSFYRIVFSIPDIESKKNFVDNLFFSYFDAFIWKKDSLITPFKQGFFFFNSQDAKEILHSSQSAYFRSFKRYGPLQIFPLKLGVAYKWNRISKPRVHFHFIPDVKEIGDLLFKYRHYKNIKIHKSQVINKNNFKGVPIYIIQPEIIQHNNQQIVFNYSSYLKPLDQNQQILFTSLHSAYQAWSYFKSNHSSFNLSDKPNILVYNLESYIHDCEKKITEECQNFRVIPNQDIINILEKDSDINKKYSIKYFYSYKFLPTIKKMTLWSKYIFWSFTTRQKPDW
uniref:hypothetical protein n=1 Tax=Pulvinaster venetus TaxID=427767 RepID=UPI001FCD07B3|nr:hypothetical protein MW436_pgp175 [Pulvinaster venetus]UNJ16884.1 hypothetical protein [Pulvinaster venetus]